MIPIGLSTKTEFCLTLTSPLHSNLAHNHFASIASLLLILLLNNVINYTFNVRYFYMTTYVNAMTYFCWSCLHEMSSLPHDGQQDISTIPAPPSRNERMTESTIVCNMYKRQCCTSDRCTGTQAYMYMSAIYELNSKNVLNKFACYLAMANG